MKRLILWIGMLGVWASMSAAVPYFIAPQDFAAGLPAGWTIDYSSEPQLSDGVNHLGLWQAENGYMTVHTTNPEAYCVRLLTPAVDVSTAAAQPVVRFAHRQPGIEVAGKVYLDTLSVYIRTSAGQAWRLLQRYTTPITAWQVDELPLDNYNIGTGYQIAFEAKDGNGQGVMLDDVSVYVPSRCTDVRFGVMQIEARQSIIELVRSSAATQYELAVSTTQIDPDVVDLSTVAYHAVQAGNTFTLTTLTSNTDYYVYARTNCLDNESGYTNWVDTTILTPMLVSLPYVENFNAAALSTQHLNMKRLRGWTMTGSDDCAPFVWTGASLTNTGRKNIWKLYSEDVSPFLAFCRPDWGSGRIVEPTTSTASSCLQPGEWAFAATPEIDGDLSACQALLWGTTYSSFYNGAIAGSEAGDYGAELIVGVMSDVLNWRSFVPLDTVRVDHAYQFKRFAVNLTDAPSDCHHVVLAVQPERGTVFYVDNVEVRRVTASTAVPTDVRLTNLTPTGFDLSARCSTMDVRVFTASQYKDSLVLPTVTPLFTRDGATGTVHVTLPESAAGQFVSVYVGQGGQWAFPQTLRVPTAISAVPYTVTFDSPTLVKLKTMGNEVCSKAPATSAVTDVLWPLRSWTMCPLSQTEAPKYNGTAGLKLYGIDNYIVLPYLDSVANYELEFYLSAGSSNYAGCSRVAVGVMTDPYDLSTFTQLYTADGLAGDEDALNTAYLKFNRSLDTYTGTGKYIAIRAIAPSKSFVGGSKNYIDHITVRTIEPCRAASGLSATAGATDVSLRWDANGMSAWKVGVYRDLTLEQPVVEQVVTGTPAATLTGLEQHTDYVAAVRTICGADTLTDVARVLFRTRFGLPYIQDWTVEQGQRLPADWYTATSGNAYPQLVSVNSSKWIVESCATMADRHFQHDAVNGSKYAVVSPLIAVDNDADKVLRVQFNLAETLPNPDFEGYQPDEDQREGLTFAVLISDNDGQSWSVVDGWGDKTLNSRITHTIEEMPSASTRYTYILPGYAGRNVRLAFYAYSASLYTWSGLHVGGIRLEAVSADCGGVTNLHVAKTFDRSAVLAWDAQGSTDMTVEVSESSAFTASTVLAVTGTQDTLRGLQPNTLYYVRVRQACDTDGEWQTLSFRTNCAALTPQELGMVTFAEGEVSVRCWEMNVDRIGTGGTTITPAHVVSEDGHNCLEICKPANTETAKYGNDYDAVMPDLTVDQITDYQLIFLARTRSMEHNTARLSVGAYTDYGIYTQLDSIALTTTMTEYRVSLAGYSVETVGDAFRSLMFRIAAPADSANVVLLDSIRLRLLVSECAAPTALSVDSVGMAAVRLAWTGDADGHYLVEVAEDAQFARLTRRDTVSGTIGVVRGLRATTRYYARVAQVCSRETSEYTSAVSFTTVAGLTAVRVVDVTDTQLACTLTAIEPNLVQYQMAVSERSVSDPLTLDVRTCTALPMTADSLTPGTQYYIYARAINASGDTTEWKKTSAFTAYVMPYRQASPAAANGWSTTSYGAQSPLICSRGNHVILSCRLSSASDIRVSADLGQTWTTVASGVSGKHVSDLSNYCASRTFYLAFSGGLSAVRDVVLDVARPLSLAVDTFGGDYATLSVSGLEPGGSLLYAYGPAPYTPDMADASVETDSIFTVDGLSSGTQYALYAAAVTVAGDTSAWYGPATWETTCGLFLLTPETFSNASARRRVGSGNYTYSMQNCWSTLVTPASDAADYCQPRVEDNNEYYHSIYAHTGTGALRMYSNAMTTAYAILPELDPEIAFDSLELCFWGRAGYQSYDYIANGDDYSSVRTIVVGVMTDPTDATTFRALQTITVAQEYPVHKTFVAEDPEGTLYWRHYTVSLLGAEGRYLAFKSAGKNHFYIDDVMLQTRQGCSAPTNLQAEVQSRSAVTLTWAGASARYAVALSDSYGNPIGTDTVSVATLTYTRLDAGTTYSVRVQGLCTGGEASEWSEPLSFTTAMGLSFAEDFDEVASLVPSLWKRYRGQFTDGILSASLSEQKGTASVMGGDATDGYEVGSFGSANLTGFTERWLNYQYYYTNRYAWIVTPALDLTDVTDSVRLSFEIGASALTSTATDFDSRDRLLYIISEDGGRTWFQRNATVVDLPSLTTTARYVEVDLSAYRGRTIAIAFYSAKGESTGDGMGRHRCVHIDNVRVEALNPDCGGIRALRPTVYGLDSLRLDWTVEGNDSVEVLLTTAEGVQVVDTVVRGSACVLRGLAAHTRYTVQAVQLCGGSIAKTQLQTSLSVPLLATLNATVDDFEWTRHVLNGESEFKWWLINDYVGKNHILPGMSDAYGYYLIVESVFESRLESPEIILPALASDEQLYLTVDAAVKGGSYGSGVAAAMDDDRFGVQVEVDGVWQTVAMFQTQGGGTLLEWGTQVLRQDTIGQLTFNLSSFAGHAVRLGIYGASNCDPDNGGCSDLVYVLDEVSLRRVVRRSYTASTCTSAPYQDRYFEIPAQQLVLGTSDYEYVAAALYPAPDTIVQMSLTVSETYFLERYDTLCANTPYVRGDVLIPAPKTDTYRYSYTAANGCDSTVLIHLFVYPDKRSEEQVLRCLGEEYVLGGRTYRSSCLIRDTVSDPLTGCDSVHTVLLEFSPRAFERTDLSVVLCPGDFYLNEAIGEVLTRPGHYEATVPSVYGCDSTVVVDLYVADDEFHVYDTVLVTDLPYRWSGEVRYTEAVPAGDYMFNTDTECGMPARVYLHIADATGYEYLYRGRRADKFILDGRLYIRVGDALYDASGLRL